MTKCRFNSQRGEASPPLIFSARIYVDFMTDRRKAWKLRNPDKVRESKRRWDAKNRERENTRKRRYDATRKRIVVPKEKPVKVAVVMPEAKPVPPAPAKRRRKAERMWAMLAPQFD